MAKMDSCSISCIVTDPPYGLHFMGKSWDNYAKGSLPIGRKVKGAVSNSEAHEAARYDARRNDEFQDFITQVALEALRIVKPGGHMLMFGAPRRFHRQTCALEDAGWEIRDCLMWLYGSGFPKSHNHFGMEGYGTALKPAWETIIMAMKPCDGTFKQNAEKWGQAGINIDACRIGNETITTCGGQKFPNLYGKYNEVDESQHKGRWPANVLLDEEAAKMLDEQSGINASRFFYCPKASSRERDEGLEELPLKKLAGCYGEFAGDGRGRQTEHQPKRNNHPTVKPLKLMEYLIKLVMPPGDGLLLDPFAGSGTTILAAQNLGFKAIGIEKDPGYCEIARKRCGEENEKE